MYNYDFKVNGEQIEFENKGIVDINSKSYNLCVVKTNKNILLFNNVSSNDPLKSRGVTLPEDYLLELSIPLENLKYKVEDNNTIINYENNEIILWDIKLNND